MRNKETMNDLLIRAIIDKNDLSKSELIWLEQKDVDKSETLLAKLANLGKMAVECAPTSMNTIELHSKSLFSAYFRPIVAGSFVFLVLLFIFIQAIYVPGYFNNQNSLDLVYQEIEVDRKLMNEIGILVDSATFAEVLPDSNDTESKYDFSDEFMEMVVSL